MANKVLGIEIGQNITRVVEIDYKTKKNPKIYNIFDFTTPQDMMAEGVIQDVSMFRSLLASKLKENKISTKKALFVLNSSRIATREVEIPAVKDKQIKEMIKMNASDYFPVDLEQYELVHEVLERVEGEAEKKIRVSVIAVPKDLIRSYELLANACKLQLVGLDYTGNAIKQLMLKEIHGEVKATVKIDENMTILTVIDGEQVKLQRIINYGIAGAIEEIQDSEVFGEYLSFTQAMDIARRRTCLSLKNDNQSDEQRTVGPDENYVDADSLQRLRGNVTVSLSSLINSLSRVIDYYNSRNVERPIEKIFLIGMGADFSGLSKLLTLELNYKVIPLQQFEGILINRNLKTSHFKVAEYFTCIGASIKPLEIISGGKASGGKAAKIKTKQSPDGEVVEVEEDSASYGKPLLVCGVCILAAIGLVAYSIFSNLVLKTENVTLQNQVNELAYAQELHDNYNAAKIENDWAKALDKQTFNRNNELVSLIEELEQKMPTDMKLLALNATTNGVEFSITVNNKETAADVIKQLRTFETIDITTVSGITEEKNDTGASEVNFSVSCSYVAVVDQTDETGEEGTQTSETEQSTEVAE